MPNTSIIELMLQRHVNSSGLQRIYIMAVKVALNSEIESAIAKVFLAAEEGGDTVAMWYSNM